MSISFSISNAIGNALSGLAATGRSAATASSNIANSMTEGYGRREVVLTTETYRSGVHVKTILRHSDLALTTDRRFAGAEAQGEGVRATALSRIQEVIGRADSDASLSARIGRLGATLTEAASRPDAAVRLEAVTAAAKELAGALNRASDGVQQQRLTADRAIANDVETLRDSLARVQKLNQHIVARSSDSRDVNTLIDQRNQLIERIAAIVPVRELPRQGGAVALMTPNGTMLLDSKPAQIEFTPVNAMTARNVIGDGVVGGISIGGKAIDMGVAPGRLSGGTLAAHFDVRDRLAPEVQQTIDGLARDLIERFQSATIDPTIGAGPGLFTDAGGTLDITDTRGLAGRIGVNPAVDPRAGGESWKLRDGLGALAEGPQGDSRILGRMIDALAEARSPTSPSLGSARRDAGALADEVLSRLGGTLYRREEAASHAAARSGALAEQELAGGVDTDFELQNLLQIEKAYGANVKVIQTADAMLQRILEI